MTVLEHIKHMIVGLTVKEKEDLAGYLAEPDLSDQQPKSLRGEWSSAFPDGAAVEELKGIRGQWQKEWRSGEFVG